MIFLIVVFLFISSQKTNVSNSNDDKDKDYYSLVFEKYQNFSLYIPDTLYFAGEQVPLQNYYVRERLEREILAIAYWHSRTMLILKRSRRYFPIFEKILKENGIPDDFKYLAMAESELAQSISPAGASGIWQLMKSVAIKYGLEINNDVDERFNVEKSTFVACNFLRDLYKQFRSWTMAAAAYNMGPTRLPDLINEQGVSSYYDLVLPEETSRYVYRIIAFKLIYENPRQYGFFLRNKDLYYPIPTKKIEVDTTINDLSAFARQNNINLLLLKEFNPWMRTKALKNQHRKKYVIEIPLTTNYYEIYEAIENPYDIFNDYQAKE